MSKYVTVSSLEQGDQKDPIWVLNGSSESELGQPGEVHVGIPKVNGTKIDDLYIPQTWLPICVTDQIPRPQLLASSEFRTAVNNKLLILVSPTFAAEILEQDGVEEERDRLSEMRRAVREATASRSISDSGAEVISTSEIQDNRDEVVAEAKGDELDAGFLMFANTLDEKTDIEALNLIRGRGKFTSREVRHLLKSLRDKPKVEAFFRSKMVKK